ncbi:hypothetical protein AB9P05_15730 [Roseivirga sp. BDSF3-8]|uniref:hypothetical protein n=1 Tax=Roseivirga sp. BDSF3-8 TaxID=3241598 RepID=UPI0035324E61
MSNYWTRAGIPRKGWALEGVIDIREEGQPVEDTEYETCMMCGNEKIRYVHLLSHPSVDDEFRVGCVCAEKLTEDYKNPKQKERELKNIARRRQMWIAKPWKISKSGNPYLKLKEYKIVIFAVKEGAYKVYFNDKGGKIEFKTLEMAKAAVFNHLETLKNKSRK